MERLRRAFKVCFFGKLFDGETGISRYEMRRRNLIRSGGVDGILFTARWSGQMYRN